MLKRTPLFDAHRKHGARLVEFGGWEMPVQYTSIVDEHHAVRTAAGIFDISHMGELWVTGPDALEFLNRVLTNDLRKLSPGHGQYTLMCNEHGGTIDDLYAYQLGPEEFFLIVNASRIDADFHWLQKQALTLKHHPCVQVENRSAILAAAAVQGPAVSQFIDHCFNAGPIRPTQLPRNHIAQISFRDSTAWISRTGYTGEDGFEIVAPNPLIETIWNHLLDIGKPYGLKPAGLGARDTLRTEMCYPLYGHELNEQTTPLEAGLGRFVALDKPEFVGAQSLRKQKADGLRRQCVAFVMTDRSAPPRPDYPIWSANSDFQIGHVVSGTQSPSLNVGIGLGYVPPSHANPGTPIQIEIRGRRTAATTVRKPIYKKAV